MRMLTSLLAAILCLAFAVSAHAADKKKKAETVKGTVTALQKDSGKETGMITLKTATKKKAAQATATAAEEGEKKFRVTEDTKVERVSGKKGDVEKTPAKFADLKTGDQIMLTTKAGASDVAATISIATKKKKAK